MKSRHRKLEHYLDQWGAQKSLGLFLDLCAHSIECSEHLVVSTLQLHLRAERCHWNDRCISTMYIYSSQPEYRCQSCFPGMSVVPYMINLVDLINTLSLSAIATNGTVCGKPANNIHDRATLTCGNEGEGAYHLISRLLGPEFGGSMGIVLILTSCSILA